MKGTATHTQITSFLRTMTMWLRLGAYDEHALLDIYTEETEWANESVVYNTTQYELHFRFSVMLNRIIIINWISNGLLLVVQEMQPTIAAASNNNPNKQPLAMRYQRADTCNLGLIVSIWLSFWSEFITQLFHIKQSFIKFFDDVFLLARSSTKWSSAFEATRKINILFQTSTHFALYSSHSFKMMSNPTNGTITKTFNWFS